MSDFRFKLLGTDGAARLGVIHTPRGEIRTPAFMPVGTAGTVKAMYMDQVRDLGADIVLGNTYHLMVRPGAERVADDGVQLGARAHGGEDALHDGAREPLLVRGVHQKERPRAHPDGAQREHRRPRPLAGPGFQSG